MFCRTLCRGQNLGILPSPFGHCLQNVWRTPTQNCRSKRYCSGASIPIWKWTELCESYGIRLWGRVVFGYNWDRGYLTRNWKYPDFWVRVVFLKFTGFWTLYLWCLASKPFFSQLWWVLRVSEQAPFPHTTSLKFQHLGADLPPPHHLILK